MVGGLIGGAAAVGAALYVRVRVRVRVRVLGAAGFTAAGVAAGSVGAAMMNYGAAVPGGAAVVGTLSVRAAGAGWKIATAGAAAGSKIVKAVVYDD